MRNVFIDVDSIPPGANFPQTLDKALNESDVVLAVIGKGWFGPTDQGGTRLKERKDFVRHEIVAALKRGITVIPVLVDSASVPSKKELPEPLSELSNCQVIVVRPPQIKVDMDQLVLGLKQIKRDRRQSAANNAANPKTWVYKSVTTVSSLIVLLIAWYFNWVRNFSDPSWQLVSLILVEGILAASWWPPKGVSASNSSTMGLFLTIEVFFAACVKGPMGLPGLSLFIVFLIGLTIGLNALQSKEPRRVEAASPKDDALRAKPSLAADPPVFSPSPASNRTGESEAPVSETRSTVPLMPHK